MDVLKINDDDDDNDEVPFDKIAHFINILSVKSLKNVAEFGWRTLRTFVSGVVIHCHCIRRAGLSAEVGWIRPGPSVSNLLGPKWYSDMCRWHRAVAEPKGLRSKRLKHFHT